MELDDIKNLWKEEYDELEKRVSINEKKIMEMNMEKQMKGLEKMFNFFLLGKYLGFIYMLISLYMTYVMRGELIYSIPTFIGALVMLRGWYVHQGIEKPNMATMSMIELQKSISKFRIHTAKYKMHDGICTIFWLITIAPAYMRSVYGFDVYGNSEHLNTFLLFIGGMIIYIAVFALFFYKKADKDLSETEEYLDKLVKFEQYNV